MLNFALTFAAVEKRLRKQAKINTHRLRKQNTKIVAKLKHILVRNAGVVMWIVTTGSLETFMIGTFAGMFMVQNVL